MKTFKAFFILSITALLAVSCSKDDVVEQKAPDTFKFTLDATLPGVEDTRASVESVVRLKWAAGDKLSVINLTTGKALGGNLTADASGIKSTFSGTLTGKVNSGDKLAFIYPSQGYTAETTFSGATLDFSKQNGTVNDKLAVYATYTATSNNISSAAATFNYLMSYMRITFSDLPASYVIKSSTISAINNALTLSISGGELVATASGAGQNIVVTPVSGIMTNSLGFATLCIAVPASVTGTRTITAYDGSYYYKASFTNAALSAGKYYSTAVACGDLPQLVYIPDANFKAALVADHDTDHDGEISVAEALNTSEVRCSHKNYIEDLTGIEAFIHLNILVCNNNNIKTLDLSHNTALTTIQCNDNDLTTLDVSANTQLRSLKCDRNRLTTIDISANTLLEKLYCEGQTSDGTTWQNIVIQANAAQYPNWTTICQDENDRVSCVDLTYVYIPDANFKQYLVENFDTDHDDKISYDEARAITTIDCQNKSIADLTGIEACTKLTDLTCDNNQITTLDLTRNTSLIHLFCTSNSLTTLNVSHNTELTSLFCLNNQLTTLDITHNTALTTLYCQRNRLTTIDISANIHLDMFYCKGQTSDGSTSQNIVIQANATQYPNWTNICRDEDSTVSCVQI